MPQREYGKLGFINRKYPMADQKTTALQFAQLHQPGSPVVLYNIWDPGSAQAVAGEGAKAIATGSHGVANTFGYEDGELIPLQLVLENVQRILKVTDLPLTMDIETGYGTTRSDVAETTRQVIEAGAVGVNIEDQLFGSSDLRDTAEQADRIRAVREAAESAGIPLFINSRSDLFKNAKPEEHTSKLVEQALERARAYADAGADGFFLPGIANLELIKQLCDGSPVPVNIIKIPGTPSTQELAVAGVARISYGPVPYLQMIEWLKAKAKLALSGE